MAKRTRKSNVATSLRLANADESSHPTTEQVVAPATPDVAQETTIVRDPEAPSTRDADIEALLDAEPPAPPADLLERAPATEPSEVGTHGVPAKVSLQDYFRMSPEDKAAYRAQRRAAKGLQAQGPRNASDARTASQKANARLINANIQLQAIGKLFTRGSESHIANGIEHVTKQIALLIGHVAELPADWTPATTASAAKPKPLAFRIGARMEMIEKHRADYAKVMDIDEDELRNITQVKELVGKTVTCKTPSGHGMVLPTAYFRLLPSA